jgi:hypothetical protein
MPQTIEDIKQAGEQAFNSLTPADIEGVKTFLACVVTLFLRVDADGELDADPEVIHRMIEQSPVLGEELTRNRAATVKGAEAMMEFLLSLAELWQETMEQEALRAQMSAVMGTLGQSRNLN